MLIHSDFNNIIIKSHPITEIQHHDPPHCHQPASATPVCDPAAQPRTVDTTLLLSSLESLTTTNSGGLNVTHFVFK